MATDPATRTARFAAAKGGLEYGRAMEREPPLPRKSWLRDVVVLVVLAGVTAGFVALEHAMYPRLDVIWVAIPLGAIWLITAAGMIAFRLAPTKRQLVTVETTWTDRVPAGALATRTRREVTLAAEDGSTRGHIATEQAANQVTEGDLGVAYTRGRTLIWFERLDA